MIELKSVAHFVSDKTDVSTMKMQDYITTDNMIVNRGGIVDSESLPQATRVTKYSLGDVLVSNIRPYFKKIWYADKTGGCSNDVIVFRTNSDQWDSKFLYYVLSQDAFFDFMMAGSNGTKMPRGDKKTIPDFLVPEYEIKEQCRIAGILSAYDNLIENNQKQIKLLEEAAQRLYKEWFVDLRFPGYEATKIVDGVPEGWKKGLLQELVEINYGKDHKKAPEDGNIPVYGSGGLMRKCDKSLYKGESVLIPRKGSLNHIMYVNEEFWTVDTMFFATVKQEHTALFIYFYIRQYDMYAMNIGAAVPSMTTKILNAMNILIPSQDLFELFDKYAQTYFRKIELLNKENESLIQARDRLLPKLMSGQLEV